MPKPLRVFVSSTSEDLRDHRAAARLVILDQQWTPTMMEHFGAIGGPSSVEACCTALGECDLVLLIVAWRRGWVPTPEEGGDGQSSITALELAYAREKRIPVLALLAGDGWPGNLWEDREEARDWIRRFRQQLNLPAVFFEWESPTTEEAKRLPAFRSKVREALVSHAHRLLEQERSKLVLEDDGDAFAIAADGLSDGSAIPFIGSSLYEGGLNGSGLARTLAEDGASAESLAAAAEFFARPGRTREDLLRRLRAILTAEEKIAVQPVVHDLLTSASRPPLIVSTTLDMLLERRLAAGGPLVIVSHVLRSEGGEHDGKVIALREGEKPQMSTADRLELREGEQVVYKLLGSPLLHDEFDSELGIDTVVITETDHLAFLGRLENQHSRIPTAFSRHLQRRKVVFLGYSLDVWHYRLVMQVFQNVGGRRGAPTLAVRKPTSRMELAAWTRLGATLVAMSPADFTQRAIARSADCSRMSP